MHQTLIHQHIVIGGILALVAINKHQVELLAQRGCNLQRRADVQLNLVAVLRTVEERLRQRLQLVVHLAGVNHCALFQASSHTESRVARKSANLKDIFRAEHLDNQLQQLTLNMSRNHSRVEHA